MPGDVYRARKTRQIKGSMVSLIEWGIVED